MKTLTEYLYTGPDSGITLQDKDTSTDELLRHGKTVKLPPDNAAVRTLVAMKHLSEVPAQAPASTAPAPAPAPAKSTKASKKE